MYVAQPTVGNSSMEICTRLSDEYKTIYYKSCNSNNSKDSKHDDSQMLQQQWIYGNTAGQIRHSATSICKWLGMTIITPTTTVRDQLSKVTLTQTMYATPYS